MNKLRPVILLLLVSPGLAAAEEPLVERVRAAIDRGVDYLRRNQVRTVKNGVAQGHWDKDLVDTIKPGGFTCLALQALLTCGVPPDDPMIRAGLEYIRSEIPPRDTYVVGLQTMVFAEVGDPRDAERIQRNVDWLIGARVLSGGQLNGWGYQSGGVRADNSNSQYALLGLYAGRQAGAAIDPAVWESIRDFYTRTQLRDGGWTYDNSDRRGPTLTMTVAGLCGLRIVDMELSASKQGLRPDGVAMNCGRYDNDEAIAKALRWLSITDALGGSRLRFTGGSVNHAVFYNIYGIERAGRLTGQRFLGGRDWYREGCEFLVGIQRDDGSWARNSAFDHWPTASTSFALLFLAKGRTPILISKFAHGPAEGWNNKHSDVRHLVEYASKQLFKNQPMAWQVYDARRLAPRNKDERLAEVAALLQSPLVYLNGHDAPILTPTQKQILKQYLEEGGFVFAEACCGRDAFADGFRRLMKELFPESEFRPLPPDHALWRANAPVPPDFTPLEGLEAGCKTIAVLSPRPLAGYYEENTIDDPRFPRGRLAFRLAGNIIAYATGLEPPKPRLTAVQLFDKEERQVPRGFLKAVQLRHEGDWQPAPRAIRNLMQHLRSEHKLDVALAPEELPIGHPEMFKYKFLYLHGRARFSVPDEALELLRANLSTGGLLFADACCGSAAFDEAFRTFIGKLFPDQKLEAIPIDDPLYSAEVNGRAIRSVRVRKPERPTFEEAAPLLEGVRVDGRWVVVYSKLDVGCALEKHTSPSCPGHDHDSALSLGSAAVLYLLKQ